MALSGCTLIGSIVRDCKGVGSVLEIKVKVLPSLATITADYTYSSGSVTAIASGSRSLWYTYYMERETALFESTQNVGNGSQSYAQTGKIVFNRLSAQLSEELRVIGKNSVQIVVKTADGTNLLFGYEQGMDIVTSKGSTGTAKTDRNGYEIDFAGSERYDAPFISDAIYATLVT
jgi:hypothetical protein